MRPFLYERLARALLAEMASGVYWEGKRFLSLRKICSLWGVSEPTAQNALRLLLDAGLIKAVPRSGLVLLPEFQQKALLLLHKTPLPTLPPPSTWETKRSQLLQTAAHRPRRFGIILDQADQSGSGALSDPADLAALQASRSFFQEALKLGCEVEFFYQNGTAEQQNCIMAELSRKKIEAVTCFRRFQTQEFRPVIEKLVRLTIPVLTLFDDCEHVATSSINFNNIGAGYDAGRILLDHGHRRIVALLPWQNIANLEQRLEGIRLALAESTFADEASLIVCRLHPSGNPRALMRKAFFDDPHSPTAIFSPGISTYLKIAPILKSLGLRPPGSLSVIGCGNRELLPSKLQNLDLMHLDFTAAGRLAFHHLWGLLGGIPTSKAILIPTPHEAAGSVMRLSIKKA